MALDWMSEEIPLVDLLIDFSAEREVPPVAVLERFLLEFLAGAALSAAALRSLRLLAVLERVGLPSADLMIPE